MDKKILHIIAFSLVIVGAVNWGFVGLLEWNVVHMLLSSVPLLEKVVYILVGLAGVYLAATHREDCKICSRR